MHNTLTRTQSYKYIHQLIFIFTAIFSTFSVLCFFVLLRELSFIIVGGDGWRRVITLKSWYRLCVVDYGVSSYIYIYIYILLVHYDYYYVHYCVYLYVHYDYYYVLLCHAVTCRASGGSSCAITTISLSRIYVGFGITEGWTISHSRFEVFVFNLSTFIKI